MAIIGSKGFAKGDKKYFYKLTRSADNDLILTKVEVTNSQGETIELVDPTLESAENSHTFRGFATDYIYINMYSREDAEQNAFVRSDFVDPSYVSNSNTISYKDIIDQPLGVTQYLVRNEDIDVSVDENGNFIVSVNT
jgi:hypothetical protein